MAKKQKVVTVLSTAAITGLITAAVGSTAFAKTNGVLVNSGSNDYKYDLSALQSAFDDNQMDSTKGVLYQDYSTKLSSGKVLGLYDDAQSGKVIDYSKVAAAFENAQLIGTAFDLNAYTAKSTDYVAPTAPIYDQAVGSDGKLTSNLEQAPVTNLAVSSAQAINLKQVVVTFNEAVDTTSATTIGNYSATGNSIAAATVNADGKSVTLTLATKLTNQTGKVTVTVTKNVKDASGKALGADYVAKDLSYTDLTLPTVDSVAVVGNKKINVTFSEPISSTTVNYKLDGVLYSGAVTVDPAQRTLTINTLNALSAGNHTIEFEANSFTDLNNLNNADVTKTFTVNSVTTTPVASIKSANQQKIVVQFDREITAAPTITYNGVAITPTKVDDKTYYVIGQFPPAGGQLVVAKGVTDYYGNATTADQTLAFVPTIDATKPVLSSITSTAEGKIVLGFNKDIASAAADGTYVVKDSNGNTVAYDTVAFDKDSLNNDIKSTIILSGTKFTSGTYKVSVSGLKDASGNAMDAVTDYALSIPDTTAPIYTGAAINQNKVSAVFNEKVDSATALNLSNYQYEVGGKYYALPAGSSITLNSDGQGVIVTLPDVWTMAGKTYSANGTSADNAITINGLLIGGIKDLAGNQMVGSVEHNNSGDTPSDVASIVATDKNTIKITFKNDGKSLPANVIGSDFTVGNYGVQSATVDSVNRVVTLKLANPLPTDLSGVPNVSATSDLKTALGTVVPVTGVPTSDGIAPELKSVSTDLKNEIVLTFSEKLSSFDATKVVLKNANGTVLAPPTIVGGSTNTNTITLKVDGSNLSTGNNAITFAMPSTYGIDDIANNQLAAVADEALTVNIDNSSNNAALIAAILPSGTTTKVNSDGTVTATLDATTKGKTVSDIIVDPNNTTTINSLLGKAKTISLEVNGSPATLSITTTDTAATLANKINNVLGNPTTLGVLTAGNGTTIVVDGVTYTIK